MAEQVTKIDIFSGFLGAGKTTLIKKLIKEAFQGEKIVLIENEFGGQRAELRLHLLLPGGRLPRGTEKGRGDLSS